MRFYSKTKQNHKILILIRKSIYLGFSPSPGFNTNTKILGKSINHSKAGLFFCFLKFFSIVPTQYRLEPKLS